MISNIASTYIGVDLSPHEYISEDDVTSTYVINTEYLKDIITLYFRSYNRQTFIFMRYIIYSFSMTNKKNKIMIICTNRRKRNVKI